RRDHVLFIDARKLGVMVDRRHRELTAGDIKKISDTYHSWRGEFKDKKYVDVLGFCKSAPLDEIRKHGWILTPGGYVGAEEEEDDAEPFEEKMSQLAAELSEERTRGRDLDEEIRKSLEVIGFRV